MMTQTLSLYDRLHALHRAWRFRLRSEKNEVKFILTREMAGGTAVDIGAYRGVMSYWMLKAVGPAGDVVAFEPQPELAEFLHRFRKTFRFDRMHIENMGLSSEGGSRILVRPQNHWGGSSLEQERERPGDDSADRFTVQVTTLDTYFASHADLRPIRFIKCDVEGHELSVFQGAKTILAEDRPEMLIEVSNRHVKEGSLFRLLDEAGYDAFFFCRGTLEPMSRHDELRPTIADPYLNFVFKPR